MLKLTVMVSGTGSILEAILASGLKVDMVIADRLCTALLIAEKAGIARRLIFRKFGHDFNEKERDIFSQKISVALDSYKATDVVAMAGFKTVLSPIFFLHYKGIILNTHPSLLPDFKGNHAVRQAFDAGVNKTGCTVHIATECMDEGRILAQQEVFVLKGDTEAILHERIKEIEKVLYPKVISDIFNRFSVTPHLLYRG